MFSSFKLQSTPSGITPPTAYTAEERVAYVKYLDVDVASTADAGYSAAVNGCGAVVYLTGVTAQTKSVLQGVGWVVDKFRLRDISNANRYGSVDRLVLELAGSFLTEAGLESFKGMLNGLRDAVRNSAALKILNERAAHGNSAGFQVGVVSNEGDNAVFKEGEYYYNSSETVTSALFNAFGSAEKVDFLAGNRTMVLNDSIYSQARDAIREKVDKGHQHLIKEIQLQLF